MSNNHSGKSQAGQGGFGGRGGHRGRFMPGAKAKDSKVTLKRLWKYLSDKKNTLALILTLVVFSVAFILTGPLLIGRAIDQYIIPKDFQGLMFIVLMMAGVYIFGALFTWLQSYLTIGVAQETVKEIRKDLFEKLQTLPLSYFDSHSHGDMMSRLTNDVENISQNLNTSMTQIFSSVITLAGTIVMMFYLSPILTLLTLTIIPVMFFCTGRIARRTRKLFTEQQKMLGQLNGFIEETISGQKVVKIFCREEENAAEFEDSNRGLKGIAIRAQIFSGIIPPLMNALNNIGFVIVASIGGYLAIKQIITVGVIASFINYTRQFARPLNELANQFNMIQSALAGAERVFEVLDEKSEPADARDALVLEKVVGSVRFDDVSFSYKKDTVVLKDIHFDVNPGQTVALVGPTGSGKTTIINLLTRFYDIDQGVIYIDGQDIRNVKRDRLRSLLGIVLQDTYLFSESVRENIRYGRLNATDEEVESAAKLAYADQFIHRLPQGYDTVVTEEGGNLSQGQRQLLAIARAILANPAILILDEATSNVDTRTEYHIQEAMRVLMKDRTSFVIAHRLSTIKDADMILVINGGEIIESGTHEALLKQKGFYDNLYNNQFRRQGLS